MDSVSHLTNAVMEVKSALMAVMKWTAVSIRFDFIGVLQE